MSIINQMLKDIDQRERQNHPGGRANYVYSGRSLRSRRWVWALSGVAVVVILFLLLWGFSLLPKGENENPLPTAEQLRIERVNSSLAERAVELAAAEQRLAEREQALANAAEQATEQTAAGAVETSTTGANQAASRSRAQSLAAPVVSVVGNEATPAASTETSGREPSANAAMQSTDMQSTDIQNAVSETPAVNAVPESRNEPEEIHENAGQMTIERSDSRTATAPTLHRRGLEALEAGDSRQAIQRFQEALLVSPDYHESRLQLAALQFGRGFAADALELLRDGLQLAPTNTEFLLLKARIYDRIEQPQFALELLRGVSARLPRDADILLMRANLASDAGDYALAISSYQQLVAWRSDQGSWWLGYGYALEQYAQVQGENSSEYVNLRESAAEAYRRALQDSRLSLSGQEFALDRREALNN